MIDPVLVSLLGPLAVGGIHADTAPMGVKYPFITYQQVGGQAVNFLDPTVPDKKHARIQINVWSKSRQESTTLIRQIEDLLRSPPANGYVEGASVSQYNFDAGLYGSRQDFSFWF